jgi:hypothetical protein
MEVIMKKTQLRSRKHGAVAVLLAAVMVLSIALIGVSIAADEAEVGTIDYTTNSFQQIPGTYSRLTGARNGYNFYHMESSNAGVNTTNFWRDTFCTHKDINGGGPESYVYYYNSVLDDYDNDELMDKVLNSDGIGFSSVKSWQDLRYCIVLAAATRNSAAQSIYWSYLGHYFPNEFSTYGSVWNSAYSTSWFGVLPTSDFYGLGAITDDDYLKIGASVDVTSTVPSGTVTDGVDDDKDEKFGPYSISWKAGSDPVLAQLNSGTDKTTPPLFSLSTDRGNNGLIRFYDNAACAGAPITTIRLGQKFWIKFNSQSPLAGTYANDEIPVIVTARQAIITKVLGDQFFLAAGAENQINVKTESKTPKWEFNVKFTNPPVEWGAPPPGAAARAAPTPPEDS